MNRNNHKTPPRPRNRRNSFGDSPSRQVNRGRRRSKSISSPRELHRISFTKDKNDKRGKFNKSGHRSKFLNRSKHGNGMTYINKVRKKRDEIKKKEKHKIDRQKMANERFGRLNKYMAEFKGRIGQDPKMDIMRTIKERMGRFIKGEISRNRHRERERAAQKIKAWYFKSLPVRREFLEYWNEMKDTEGAPQEDSEGSVGVNLEQALMTPQNRVIRMKEELRRKYSPCPSPNSLQNSPIVNEEQYDDDEEEGEYIGDELDLLDEEYHINITESTRKERESVESSVVGVADFEKSDMSNIYSFIRKCDENDDEMIEDEDYEKYDDKSYSLNLHSFQNPEGEGETSKRDTSLEDEGEGDMKNIPSEAEEAVDNDALHPSGAVEYERTSLVSPLLQRKRKKKRRRRRRRSHEDGDENIGSKPSVEEEKSEVQQEPQQESRQEPSYLDMFLDKHNAELEKITEEEEEELEDEKKKNYDFVEETTETPKEEVSEVEEKKNEADEVPVQQEEIKVPGEEEEEEPKLKEEEITERIEGSKEEEKEKNNEEAEEGDTKDLGEEDHKSGGEVEEEKPEEEVEEEKPGEEEEEIIVPIQPKKICLIKLEKSQLLNRSGSGQRKKRRKITRTTTVTTQQTRECCTIL